MAQDWYRWYPTLYSAKAIHLTTHEDACYRRLIDHYMTTRQPLDARPQALAAICRIGLDQWMQAAPNVLPFFEENGGKLHHERCDAELSWQDNRSKTMSEVARKGAESRWSKTNELNAVSMPAAMQEEKRREEKREERLGLSTETPTESSSTPAPRSRKIRSASPAAKLPSDWKPTPEQIALGVSFGLTQAKVIAISVGYKAYWTHGRGSQKMRNARGWNQTWINWITREAKDAGVYGQEAKPYNPVRPFKSQGDFV